MLRNKNCDMTGKNWKCYKSETKLWHNQKIENGVKQKIYQKSLKWCKTKKIDQKSRKWCKTKNCDQKVENNAKQKNCDQKSRKCFKTKNGYLKKKYWNKNEFSGMLSQCKNIKFKT